MKILMTAAAAASLLSALASAVRADEQMVPLAVSGGWVAMEHRVSMTGAPDVCVAMSIPGQIGFRSDGDRTEVRVLDDNWSLPPHVEGQVQIDVGKFHLDLDIQGNTGTQVELPISEDQAGELFAAMDKASSMTVTMGTAKPRSVALSGSTKVTNAFRICAGISNGAAGGGNNPFSQRK